MVDSFLGQAEEGNKTALLKLQLIGHYIMGGDFSITDLSHEMNLSVPTVTKLVSELIEEGFVHDFGKQGTAGGRRPNIYGLNPYAGYFVGVDIKKDIITLAIINFKGQVVDMRDCVPFVMENSVQGARPVMRRGQRVHRQEQDRPCQDFFGRLQPLGAGQFQDRVQLQLFLRRGGAAHDAAGETPGLQGLCRERYPGDDLRGVHVWRG